MAQYGLLATSLHFGVGLSGRDKSLGVVSVRRFGSSLIGSVFKKRWKVTMGVDFGEKKATWAGSEVL